ncbi:MAG TPA: SGNH/GDSL hydrolase family protein [Thermoanaerobaculia bacterium]|nr:SGNH/GDSL hydrolase family protein [Thermoanaerobaculia bacterium]
MRAKLLAVLAVVLLPGALLAQVNTGDANFSMYVSMGDSLTAGFYSGGLTQTFQKQSYPALLARQATGGTADFEQPLVSAPGIPPLLALKSLSPLEIVPLPGFGQPLNLNLPRPYNNLAVPGETTHGLLTTVTDNGGLHDLILRGLGTQLQEGLALHPTFVTLWIGNNDVLGAATSGIVIDNVTLTTVSKFTADYQAIVGAIAASGAKLAVANIPNVYDIPFVTTIPPVVVDPSTNQPVMVNGQPIPLIGPNGPLSPDDHVLLTASSLLAQGIGIPAQLGGTGQPLPDSAVLSASETATIEARIAAFNQVIANTANNVGAALVDINSMFDNIAQNGDDLGGVEYTADFLTGGLFGYDGVHPTPLGYAVAANAFIRAINKTYSARIPLVDYSPYVFDPAGTTTRVSPSAAHGAIFSPAAWESLRHSLGIPSVATLERLKHAQHPTPQGPAPTGGANHPVRTPTGHGLSAGLGHGG